MISSLPHPCERHFHGSVSAGVGKQANCQVAVSLSIANHAASLPVAYRLYRPKGWVDDNARRSKAGVPSDISFKTKPEIVSSSSCEGHHATA